MNSLIKNSVLLKQFSEMQEAWTDNYMKFRGKMHQQNEKCNIETKLSTDQLETRPEKYRDYFCCCLGTKSCPTLCNPMDCSIPGSSVFHYLLEFAQIYVH